MRIAVGSTSAHKLEAVRAACAALGIVAEVLGVKVFSAVNEQPYGPEETLYGAWKRARYAIGGHADMTIGIENGLIRFGADREVGLLHIDLAAVVVIAPGACFYVATSAGVPFDQRDVDAAHAKGFSMHTAGAEMAARTGCDPTDGAYYLTGGEVSRAELLSDAVRIALAQWVRACRPVSP